MKKALFLVLLCVGCSKLPNTDSHGPTGESLFKDSGLIQGTTASDWDKIHDVSFGPNTEFQVQVNGVTLNRYEYYVQANIFYFGKDVTILPNGNITFMQPAVPAAPKGSTYIVQWTN